jgi:UDP-sulfoquinovose synthase
MQCLSLALTNPPAPGEYRVFNQFDEVYDITDLALRVQTAAGTLGLPAEIRQVENPRLEKEEHYYAPDHQRLTDLGYKPTRDLDAGLRTILSDLLRYRRRIEALKDVLVPDIFWAGDRRRVEFVEVIEQKGV